jgi:UDP-N-acetylglucosamine 2-epimerase (non-hydrolysing)
VARSLGQPAKMGLHESPYLVWTMHRPSNVDVPDVLAGLTDAMIHISQRSPVVFPVHPRTKSRLQAIGRGCDLESAPGVIATDPLSYHELLGLTSAACAIVTDSGGLQEEATALEIPCLTLRANTERPITVTDGTSTLVGSDADALQRLVKDVLSGGYKQGKCPPLWDGQAGLRVGEFVAEFLSQR